MRMKKGEKVIINVSGRRFQTRRSTLQKHPNTLLGDQKILTTFYDKKNNEYFFDRDPELFRHILNYYQAGKLHVSHMDCRDLFYDELKFYKISAHSLHKCCWGDCYEMSYEMSKNNKQRKVEKTEWGKTRHNIVRRIRKKIACFLEGKNNTFFERLFQYFVGLMIFLSIICAVAATLRCHGNTETWEQCYSNVFETLDMIFMWVFTVECALRLFSTPRYVEFFKNKFNLIDLAAISPFYIDLIIRRFTIDGLSNNHFWEMLRVLRVIRIFKLARHSTFMRKFGRRLKKALTDLGFLYFAFLLANIFFACCLYTIETLHGKPTYKSIPDTMWYTVVTMMTLG